ncbi:MAG TPA: hypothetical protein VL100_06470 [Croceibacterium sp.]|nr:hypothetical protein [Croceibacterium sp.]
MSGGAAVYEIDASDTAQVLCRRFLDGPRVPRAEGCEEAVTLGVCSAEGEHLARELMSLLGEAVETST